MGDSQDAVVSQHQSTIGVQGGHSVQASSGSTGLAGVQGSPGLPGTQRSGRVGRRRGALRSAAEDEAVASLVRAAAAGDRCAWDELVSRYVALLWSIALRHGLNESDAADVVQTTWLRLLEHIDDVRDPARVGAWLATTAQRESLRCVAHQRRLVPSDDEAEFDGPDLLLPPVDEALLAREQASAAREALDALPPTWRSLVRLLTQDPPLSYEEIGADLGVPVGSIGPTRGRCVRRMRAAVAAAY